MFNATLVHTHAHTQTHTHTSHTHTHAHNVQCLCLQWIIDSPEGNNLISAAHLGELCLAFEPRKFEVRQICDDACAGK